MWVKERMEDYLSLTMFSSLLVVFRAQSGGVATFSVQYFPRLIPENTMKAPTVASYGFQQ